MQQQETTDAPSPPVPIEYARATDGRNRPFEVLFWALYYCLGLLLGLISWKLIGGTSPVAILLQIACGLWLIAVILRVVSHRLQYAAAGAGVVLLWAPMCVQVLRRLYYWVTIGMEPADGMGSPMAFLIGFVFEWLIFLPLTALLLMLLHGKFWRNS